MSNRRALTEEEKKEIIDRLFKVWTTGSTHHLRLGQLLGNVFQSVRIDPNTKEAVIDSRLYAVEDFDLIEELEREYETYGNN